MFLSRTITAPTLARVQVERSATCRVMVMKYWCQLGRSLMARVSRDDPDRVRGEGEDEDGERGARRDHAREAERPRVVLARRVPQGQQHRGAARPARPPRPAAHAETRGPGGTGAHA